MTDQKGQKGREVEDGRGQLQGPEFEGENFGSLPLVQLSSFKKEKGEEGVLPKITAYDLRPKQARGRVWKFRRNIFDERGDQGMMTSIPALQLPQISMPIEEEIGFGISISSPAMLESRRNQECGHIVSTLRITSAWCSIGNLALLIKYLV